MASCGHCGQNTAGIRDHIRAKHGFQFYTMGPDFRYYGKNDPPRKQKNDLPNA